MTKEAQCLVGSLGSAGRKSVSRSTDLTHISFTLLLGLYTTFLVSN